MAQEHPGTSADQELLDGRYKLLETIHEGSYAKVKLAVHLPTGIPVAIKIVILKDSDHCHRHLMREIQCMEALQHPNIVELYEVIETESSVCIVMEYLGGGSLMDHLTTHGRMTEREARIIFRRLLSAVYCFHESGFAHRDIKPENILFDSKRNPKIANFGLTTKLTDHPFATKIGTPSYAAPELFQRVAHEGPPFDVWSLGVTLYRMVAGTLPFKAQSWVALGEQVKKGKYTVPYFFSFELQTLLRKMLQVNPKEREGLLEIMSDPWIHQDEAAVSPYRERRTRRRSSLRGVGFEDVEAWLGSKAACRTVQTKKPTVQPHVIYVQPYDSTRQIPARAWEEQPGTSSMPPVEQYDDVYELGQRGEKPATPPALHKVRIVTPDPSREPSPVSSETIIEPTTITPGSTPSPRTICPKSILKRCSPLSAEPSQERRATMPGQILGHSPVSVAASPELSPASAEVSLELSPFSAEASPELSPASAEVSLELSTFSAEASPELSPASAEARPELSPFSAEASPELSSASAEANRELRPWWERKTPIEDFESSTSEDFAYVSYSTSTSTSTTSIGSSPETWPRWRRFAMTCRNCLTMICCTLSKKRQSKQK